MRVLAGFTVVLAALGWAGAAEAAALPRAAVVVGYQGHSGRDIRVPATGPCPGSLVGYANVTNSPSSLGATLLPSTPRFGVICWYGTPASSDEGLIHTSLVNGRTARALSAAIDRLRTAVPSGQTHCPVASSREAVIAFGMGNGSVIDLWYNDTGCPTLDNGRLRAFETGDPAFSETFIPLVLGLLPPALRGGG